MRLFGKIIQSDAFRWPVLLAGVAGICACKPGIPGHVLSEKTMENVLYDYHLAQAMAETGDSVEQRRYLYVQAAFRKHRITEAEFDSSMVWYSSHASYLNDIYRRLEKRFDAEARVLGVGTGPTDLYAGLTASGDTANIWAEKDFYLLKPNEEENLLTFVMEADTSFYPGDSFMWRFDPRFICQEGSGEAYVALSVRFSNDSVVSSQHRLGGNYKAEISVKPRGNEVVKEVSGFVYVPPAETSHSYRLFVLSRPALIRFHKPHRNPADSVLSRDSLRRVETDRVPSDSGMPVSRPSDHRVTPRELREETQPSERTIHVVKSKPYRALPARPGQRRRTR